MYGLQNGNKLNLGGALQIVYPAVDNVMYICCYIEYLGLNIFGY